jgi:dTDP-4-dehydrorhamnose 3,5-epimerase
MKLVPTDLPGVLIVEPDVHADHRGFFMESWNERVFGQALGPVAGRFVQDNHSRSGRFVLRGLHYQLRNPQGKLVRVVRGCTFDVAVDLRRSSEYFGRWTGVTLSGENCRQVWIPPGFAHGFLVVSDGADVLYKSTAYHEPQDDRAVRWDDPDIGIDWPLQAGGPVLSARDAAAPRLSDCDCYP